MIIIFLSKDPSRPVSDSLTKWTYAIRLHKYFLLHILYKGTLIGDFKEFIFMILKIGAIHTVGFLVPKNILIKSA